MKVRRFTKMTFALLIFALIAGLSACDQVLQVLFPPEEDVVEDMPKVPDEDVTRIPVGVVLPQTGVLGPGEFGPGALVMENGFNMALEEINNSQLSDVRLKFIVEDDQSTVEGAVKAFNKLIHKDQVPVIIGVWTSHVARSVFPIAQENGVVAFSPVVIASGLTEIGDFIFRASHSTEALIPDGVKVTQEKLGYQQVATIGDSVDLFSRDSDALFKKTFADSGIEVVASETFETGDTDFLHNYPASRNRIRMSSLYLPNR